MDFAVDITGATAHSEKLHLRGEIIGLEQVEAACQRIGDNAPQALAGALFREMEAIITDSKTIEPRVPVGSPPEDKHPGTLRDSGHARMPRIHGAVVTVEGGYGGPAIPYALAQHERLDYRHPHMGEAAKYLEVHFLRRALTMDSHIAQDLLPLIEGQPPPEINVRAISSIQTAAFKEFSKAKLSATRKGWRTVGGDY